jgi:hypothetical protein
MKPVGHSSQNQARTSKKEKYSPFSLMNIDEIPQSNNGKPNTTAYQEDPIP